MIRNYDIKLSRTSIIFKFYFSSISDGRSLNRIPAQRLRTGAVASTWRTRRVWGPPPARRHHLIDPRTGAPAVSGLAGTTVLTGRAWWAEVLAKAAFIVVIAGIAIVVRTRLLPQIAAGRRTAVAVWCGWELIVLALAFGVAVVLTRASVTPF